LTASRRVTRAARRVSDETLKVVGFFCSGEIVSTFVEPLQPMGQATLTMGAPVLV